MAPMARFGNGDDLQNKEGRREEILTMTMTRTMMVIVYPEHSFAWSKVT